MTDETRRAPRGTYDVLPPESWRWHHVVRLAMDTFAGAGYAPVDTPIFEHTEIFERGVGEASEVVTKQMYTFTDRAGRSLTLRPEGTAPVVRAVLDRGLERGPLPVKLAYAGPMFRQERPQKGRYRQFFQVGIEAIGSDAAALDAEVVEVGARYLRAAGIEPTILLNSIGHPDPSCRQGYLKVLVEFLNENVERLAAEDRERVHTNPLRTFDSKEPKTVAAMADAPLITDHLCDECARHFHTVTGHLDDLDVAYQLEPRLVRGLDYYTRTAFEYVAGGLGAQNAVGGGGRYDGLSEALGGPPLPSIGFALGIDRIVLASKAEAAESAVHAYIVALGDGARRAGLKLATQLRAHGIATDLDFGDRSLKGQMERASRSGARWAVIIGDDEIAANEVTLRDLDSRAQERVPWDETAQRVKP